MFVSFLKKYYLRTMWISLLSYSHLRSIGKTGSRWDAFNLKLMSKCFNDLGVYTSLNLFYHRCNFHIPQISHLLLGKQWDNFMSSAMIMKCGNSQEIEPRLLVTARFNKTRYAQCQYPCRLFSRRFGVKSIVCPQLTDDNGIRRVSVSIGIGICTCGSTHSEQTAFYFVYVITDRNSGSIYRAMKYPASWIFTVYLNNAMIRHVFFSRSGSGEPIQHTNNEFYNVFIL